MKTLQTLVVVLLASLVIKPAAAIKIIDNEVPTKYTDIKVTGFYNYPPFGETTDPESEGRYDYTGVFNQFISDFAAQSGDFKLKYVMWYETYPQAVRKVRSGNIDMILGIYHETQLYRGLEYVYPAIIDNPITIFMLPQNIEKVKTLDDLKKLKGARSGREFYSDYVSEQMAAYQLEVVDSSYELFEKLFTGKIDYIMISQYFGLIEASKLGLRDKIGISRQVVWKMPLFIGVSKISPYRKFLVQRLTRFSEDAVNQEKIRQKLIDLVVQAEKESRGIVPPAYALEENQLSDKKQ